MKSLVKWTIALVALFAFALVMPAQAAEPIAPDASIIEADVSEAPFRAGEDVPIDLWLMNTDGRVIRDAAATVYVWAEEPHNKGMVSSALATPDNSGVLRLRVTGGSLEDYNVEFLRTGEYSLMASLQNPLDYTAPFITFRSNTVNETIPVGTVPSQAYSISLEYGGYYLTGLRDGQDATETLQVVPNSGTGTPVTVTVYDRNGDPLNDGVNIRVTTDSKAIWVDDSVLTTDVRGQATFRVYGDVSGNYKLYVNVADQTTDVPVKSLPERATMTIGSTIMLVENQRVAIDSAPIIRNDRTFVPYRALAEAFGADVTWNAATEEVILKQGDKTIRMTIGSTVHTIDGRQHRMDVAPFIQNGRTMVPVRFAAEALGFDVDVTYHRDGTTNQVVFTR